MSIRQITAGTSEPVELAELRKHLHASTEDDDLVVDLQEAARDYVETWTRRALRANTTWRLTLDDWPEGGVIELARSPVNSSTSVVVTYYPSTGGSQTWASTNYVVDTEAEPARVVLKRDNEFPTTTLRSANGVRVQFKAGSTTTPARAKHAIKMLCAHWYANRESVLVGAMSKEIEQGVKDLLWSLKVPD